MSGLRNFIVNALAIAIGVAAGILLATHVNAWIYLGFGE